MRQGREGLRVHAARVPPGKHHRHMHGILPASTGPLPWLLQERFRPFQHMDSPFVLIRTLARSRTEPLAAATAE